MAVVRIVSPRGACCGEFWLPSSAAQPQKRRCLRPFATLLPVIRWWVSQQEFLVGGVGQEFVQSELSRSDQGPPRALLEIRRKAGLRNELCMPLLQMLDQLGRSRHGAADDVPTATQLHSSRDVKVDAALS